MIDDDLGYVEPYNCNDISIEPRPDSVIYQPVFGELKKLIADAASLLRDPLQASAYHNVITRGLCQEVLTRMREHAPEECMFAVVGDMNSGKSSVINSILSIGIIARKGDGGGSCTWVVQRFMKTFSDQKSPFAAKVHFFNSEEIRAIITALLAKWYRASGKERESSECPEDRDSKAENFSDQKTVLDSFCALFCDQPEFETDELGNAYLHKAKSEDDEDIVDTLTAWAQDLATAHLDGGDVVDVETSTPEDLLFKLQPYTYTLGGEDGVGIPAPWPLVSVIDFGFEHPLLSEGIIFVDSPGLSDANTTRANNAMRHHRQCTHRITVADIARAKDDSSLRENLQQGYRVRGSGNTILVVTKGDSIDPDTDVSGSKLEKMREQKLRDEIEVLRAQKRKLTQKRARVSREDRMDFDDELGEVNVQVRSKMDDFDAIRMDMRNRAVLKALRDQYRTLTGDPRPLPAFVVGNEAYKKHQAGYPADEKPPMTVEQTSIPALRRSIYLLPAEGKLNDVLHLANVQLPNLVNSFELYCTKTHLARKDEIEAIIMRPKTDLKTILGAAYEKLKGEVQHLILDPMKLDEAPWIEEARQLCQTWSLIYQREQLNILKKDGFRKGTKKKEEVNWNGQLIKIEEDAMMDYFGNLQKEVSRILDEIGKSVASMMDRTRISIKSDPQCNLMALEPFLRSFANERPAVSRCVERTRRDLRKDISDITERATKYVSDSYLSAAMRPVYTDVCKIKGVGAPTKRAMEFERRVTKMSGVWLKVHDIIEQAISKVFVLRLKDLNEYLDEIFDGIHNQFTIICNNHVVKDEAEKQQEEELRERLQKNLIQLKKSLEGPIHEAAEVCKNYSKEKEQTSLFVR